MPKVSDSLVPRSDRPMEVVVPGRVSVCNDTSSIFAGATFSGPVTINVQFNQQV